MTNRETDTDKLFVFMTTLYEGISNARLKELSKCFEMNFHNQYIKKIYIFFETNKTMQELSKYIKTDYSILNYLLVEDKFNIILINKRPTYKMYFTYANNNIPNSKIIVSNTDIYMNNTLEKLVDYDMTGKFFSLTRWSENDDDKLYLPTYDKICYPWHKLHSNDILPNLLCVNSGNSYFNRTVCDKRCHHITKPTKRYKRRNEESQDTWIFSTPFNQCEKFDCDFELGKVSCDSLLNYRIVMYALAHSDLVISNPCLTIQCVHVDKLGTSEERFASWKKNPIIIDKSTCPEFSVYCKIPWVELDDTVTYSAKNK